MNGKQRQRVGQKQKQTQRQAQVQTQRRRDGIDLLDVYDSTAPQPGREARVDELDPDQDPDRNWTDEEVESPAEEPPLLRRLFGASFPRIHLRVRELEGGGVVVESAFRPRRPKTREALDALAAQTQEVFHRGWDKFKEPKERALLLYGTGVKPIRRLALLYRLACPASTPLGKATVDKPSELGLPRYLNKFAAFPDGLPFSLRLLFEDKRGASGGGVLSRLPDALLLLALRHVLRDEEMERTAVDDKTLAVRLELACRTLGFPLDRALMDKDVSKHVRAERLKRNGLADFFPNQRERQARYDCLSSPPSETSP